MSWVCLSLISPKNDMFPGLVFIILFGVEVILGGMITEPWPFPVRLVWLGMAFLIKANFQSAVFWGWLAGIFKDSLGHGLLGLDGCSYLLSLAIIHWIIQKKQWISDGYFLLILISTFAIQEVFNVALQTWLFLEGTLKILLYLVTISILAHGLLATLFLGSKLIWTPRFPLRKHF